MAGIELDLNNVPDSPEDLAKLFEQIESGDPADAKQEATKDDKDSEKQDEGKPEAKDEPKAELEGSETDESDAAGVATKDGKKVIPFSVLKETRDRAYRAEQVLGEMKERVAFLESLVQGQTKGAKDGESARTAQQPEVSDLSDDDLETLKEDFPTVYKAVKAAMARAEQLESRLKPVEENVQSTETERAQAATNTVQDAIDSVPKLAHIQATDAEAFELAKQFDATLRGQAKWAEKPLAERFAKVIEMVEAATGEIELPGDAKPSSRGKTVDLKAAAKAKAEAATRGGRSGVPNSLSEFPAGQHAAQDEQEEVENLTPLQLAEKFSAMTPDQMDAYFRTL